MRIGIYKGFILAYIRNNPDCTLKEISKALHIGYNYTSALTKELYIEKYVTFIRDSKTRIKKYTAINK